MTRIQLSGYWFWILLVIAALMAVTPFATGPVPAGTGRAHRNREGRHRSRHPRR